MMPAMMVSSRAAVILLVLSASVAVALSHGDGEGGIKLFGYTAGSSNGPENWGKLSPENKLCGEGKKQSPVDIVTKQAVPTPNLDTLARTYVATKATLNNNGHDISLKFEGKVGSITVNGKAYSLQKLHWHMPSEHTINGQRFPLEMHLVHKSDDGDTAVIAILYQIGDPDSFYFQLKEKLGELANESGKFPDEESEVALGPIQMRSLQKRTGSYFRYEGSLTTPPCTENVVWNILGKVRQISKEQLGLLESVLKSHYEHSARPAQPLNGRIVQFYNPPNSTISFET